jgi:hypothetical protein
VLLVKHITCYVEPKGRHGSAQTRARQDRAHCQADHERATVLRESRRQQHDGSSTHHCADHAEPALAQRRTETRLAHHCGLRAGPIGVAELEPERNVEREAHGGPQPQAEQQGRPGGARRGRQTAREELMSCYSKF